MSAAGRASRLGITFASILGALALPVSVSSCTDDAPASGEGVPSLGGSSGSSGSPARGGAAGATATAGAAGMGGAAGQENPAGSAGSGAAPGAGAGGKAGSGGSGASGASGKAGSAGASGKAGSAGASGKAGSAGASGKAGSAGAAGKGGGGAGQSGAAGQGGATGQAGAGGASCSRTAGTETAPLSLLQALEVALEAAGESEKKTLVDAFVAAVSAQGGTPLGSAASDQVAFVQRGAPFQGTYHVAGSFNGWSESALPLTALAGTDLYVAKTTIGKQVSHQYKLVDVPADGEPAYFEDRLARNVVWDGIDHHDVGELNAVVRAEAGDPAKGRLVAYRGVPSAILGDARDVFVYLPAAYDTADGSCPALPSLVVHDGNESITRAPFQLAADEHYLAHPEDSAVLIFVALPTQNQRIDEYTFATKTGRADIYGEALANEYVPFAAARHRLCPKARDRGVTGASLGGLVSTYLGLSHPAFWGYIGAQSPSYWWEDQAIFGLLQKTPLASTRIYVDNGCSADGKDQDGCDDAAAFVKLLEDASWDVMHVVETGGQHDWLYWQKRWPQMLSRFREGRTGCE